MERDTDFDKEMFLPPAVLKFGSAVQIGVGVLLIILLHYKTAKASTVITSFDSELSIPLRMHLSFTAMWVQFPALSVLAVLGGLLFLGFKLQKAAGNDLFKWAGISFLTGTALILWFGLTSYGLSRTVAKSLVSLIELF